MPELRRSLCPCAPNQTLLLTRSRDFVGRSAAVIVLNLRVAAESQPAEWPYTVLVSDVLLDVATQDKGNLMTELNKFKKILENKRDELEKAVRNREAISIEKSADALDEVQHAAERELAIRNLDRESNLLRNVRSALRRIKDGSFGVCLHCEEEISPKRLTAVPWAALCIQCQEQADRNQDSTNEMFDDMLVPAA